MFTDQALNQFLDALASKEPVPGGGSGAALAGALGAALVSMVCNLTIGKKGYEAVEQEMRGILAQTEAIREQLPRLLEADTQAYGQVMAAYRLPRNTDEEKATREALLQERFKAAADVPMRIAERCGQVVQLALPAARLGNKWAVSDAGVGALLGKASLRSALLNVEINLASINDAAYVAEAQRKMAELEAAAAETEAQVMEIVHKTIAG
ncbi:MAG TPA: cyclodeaminase/cyclohydrolase family protein [Anaerolineae bacterium]|nr:cyclodeaminase/cyclohydrolase family protein [Anaerolineae bacterium]HOQ99761.1 cyclodeaminase/cyclohydrolase family protein [Anaerolineae bacterium]